MGRRRLLGLIVVGAGLFAAGAAFSGAVGWVGGETPTAHDRGGAPNLVESQTFPLIQDASQVLLGDDEEVIGVSISKRHRAYRLAALTSFRSHVFNDLIGAVPITATYCDRDNCTQVYSSDELGHRLKIQLHGYDGQMKLEWDGRVFGQRFQSAGVAEIDRPVSLRTYPHVRTTWAKWRELHPDTDVYVGPVYMSRW